MMCAVSSTLSSVPRPRRIASAIWFAIVAVGRKTASAWPRKRAARSSSASTVGSSRRCSSPTSAAAIAARISADGFVWVSERRSIIVWRLCLGRGELTIRTRAGTMSGMGARTAEEAIYELLGQPTRTPVLVSGRAPAAPQPFQHRAWTADLDTVDFLKQREVQGVRLFAVSFEAEHERRGFTQMAILVRADQIG